MAGIIQHQIGRSTSQLALAVACRLADGIGPGFAFPECGSVSCIKFGVGFQEPAQNVVVGAAFTRLQHLKDPATGFYPPHDIIERTTTFGVHVLLRIDRVVVSSLKHRIDAERGNEGMPGRKAGIRSASLPHRHTGLDQPQNFIGVPKNTTVKPDFEPAIFRRQPSGTKSWIFQHLKLKNVHLDPGRGTCRLQPITRCDGSADRGERYGDLSCQCDVPYSATGTKLTGSQETSCALLR